MNSERQKDLGKFVAVHGIAPAYLQRAVFVVVLSFMFFLAMMFAYYIRQSPVYFLLASAFLVLYLITLFSFMTQRKNVVEVFEHGFRYKNTSIGWDSIESVSDMGVVEKNDGSKLVLPRSLNGIEDLISTLRQRSYGGN